MNLVRKTDKERKKKENEKNSSIDSSYFLGKIYLFFQIFFKYFKRLTNSNRIIMWKSKVYQKKILKLIRQIMVLVRN